MSKIEITSVQDFRNTLKENENVVIDFYASWCGACQMYKPVFEEAHDSERNAKLFMINVEELQEVAIEYNINSIPATLVFKNGKEIDRVLGYQGKEDLEKFINGASR